MFVPIQKTVVPLGRTGIYVTPGTPASPYDKDRYPANPANSGSYPIDRQGIGINVRPIAAPGITGVEIEPVVGWTKLPPVQVVHVDEKLRGNQPPPPKPKLSPPPGLEPPEKPGSYKSDKPRLPPEARGQIIVISVTHEYRINLFNRPDVFNPFEGKNPAGGTEEIRKYELWPGSIGNYPLKKTHNFKYFGTVAERHKTDEVRIEVMATAWRPPRAPRNFYGSEYNIYVARNDTEAAILIRGHAIALQEFMNSFEPDFQSMSEKSWKAPVWNGHFWVEMNCWEYSALVYKTEILLIEQLDEEPVLPPPPRIEPRGNNMSCCPRTNQLLEFSLMRISELEQKIDKLEKASGIDLTLPDDLSKENTGTKKLTSVEEAFAHLFKNIDALVGQFPIKIEVEDTDVTKEGDQKQTITIPNLAEGIAELIGIGTINRTITDATLNASIRSLVDIASTKNETTKVYFLIQAIVDYLGFKTKEKTIDLPITCNPSEADDVEKFLKESKQKIKVVEEDDKGNLQEHLQTLLTAAAIIKAALSRQFKNPVDVKDFLRKQAKADASSNDSDFRQFLEEVEQGFISKNIPAGEYKNQPYGNPQEQRPRIIEIL